MDAFFARFFPHDGDAFDGYRQIVARQLPTTGRVLDLGCGDNRQLADHRCDGREVWGTDFDRHPDLGEPQWFRPLGQGGRIPFASDTFDLIASSWVLEHVERPAFFLGEVGRVLRPGGVFVSLSINGVHYVTWLSRALHALPHGVTQRLVKRLYGRDHHDTFPTRYLLNTADQLQRRAGQSGLEVAAMVRFANVDYFSFCPPVRKVAVLVDYALERLVPGLGKLYFTVTLRKPARTAGLRLAA